MVREVPCFLNWVEGLFDALEPIEVEAHMFACG